MERARNAAWVPAPLWVLAWSGGEFRISFRSKTHDVAIALVRMSSWTRLDGFGSRWPLSVVFPKLLAAVSALMFALLMLAFLMQRSISRLTWDTLGCCSSLGSWRFA